MSSDVPVSTIPNDDDPRRLAAALGYLFTPVVPLLNMANAGDRDRWMRYHSLQALIWTGPFILLLAASVITLIVLANRNFYFLCLLPALIVVPFLPGALWARRIYLGGEVEIPIISSFVPALD